MRRQANQLDVRFLPSVNQPSSAYQGGRLLVILVLLGPALLVGPAALARAEQSTSNPREQLGDVKLAYEQIDASHEQGEEIVAEQRDTEQVDTEQSHSEASGLTALAEQGDSLEADFSEHQGGLQPLEDLVTSPSDTEPSASDEAATSSSNSKQDANVSPVAQSESSDDANTYPQPTKIRRSSFRQVLPGKSSKQDLISKWGEPAATAATDAGEVLLYNVNPFARVDVLVENETVEIIRIKLARQELPARLVERLRVGSVEPVDLIDEETGDILGISYPEKGLMLLLADTVVDDKPNAPQFATHIVIGRLDAEAFALRAESHPPLAYQKRLDDLASCLEIDSDYSYAHYLAAEVYLALGQSNKALKASQIALEIEPNNSAYRLRLAHAYFAQGDYDKSVLETRRVLDAEKKNSVVKASALHTMGQLASLGEAKISDKAIAFHTLAINIADGFATHKDDKDRITAKRVLIEAHLAIANEVARRHYERKTEVVAQWIGRASSLAEDMIENEQGSKELRLIVARDALAALAKLKLSKDPQPWIDEALQASASLRDATEDELTIARVDWLVGEVYQNALQVEHNRGKPDSAIDYGKLAIDYLTDGAVVGDIRPAVEQMVGELYFQIGAVNAVHNEDHQEAIDWYERAYPLLTAETPQSKLYVPRSQGEALVSMAVSFWNQGNKLHAIELTVAGSALMEEAVHAGVLAENSLAVPYGNLATMHRKLGEKAKADEYTKLASLARDTNIVTASRPQPASGSNQNQQTPKRNIRTSSRSRHPSKRDPSGTLAR